MAEARGESVGNG